MDRNIGVGLETQSHASVLDLDHRDFDHAFKTFRSSNHNRFVVFSRQDQHGRASIRVIDHPASRIGAAVNLSIRVNT
jgi:16S rRNA U1498 N3-methylase RsmE